jgi:uncharacterized protein YeaO (DUF488 family)
MDMTYEILLKRIQESVDPNDGARVLVDRLWPRGRRRDAMELTDWYREASPSSVLRTQYHGDRSTCRASPRVVERSWAPGLTR